MSVSESPSASLDPSGVLNRLDWQLGEIGRRQHRFAWLRDTDSGDWLAVDAYYPGNRVVVIANVSPRLQAVCENLVPRNGLYLLAVSAQELAGDAANLAKTLRARLEIQGWAPRSDGPRRDAPPPPGPAAEPMAPSSTRRQPPAAPEVDVALDQEEFDIPPDVQVHPARGASRARGGGGSAARRSARQISTAEGVGVGVTLVLAVVLELVVGGAVIGLDAGQYTLGFGFVLDACARLLGLVAASQNDDLDAAWTAVIFGSPALWGLRDGPDRGDAAPVARVTAVLAGTLLALGLIIWIL